MEKARPAPRATRSQQQRGQQGPPYSILLSDPSFSLPLGTIRVRGTSWVLSLRAFDEDELTLVHDAGAVASAMEVHQRDFLLHGRVGVYRDLLEVVQLYAVRLESSLDLRLLRGLIVNNEVPGLLFTFARVGALLNPEA